MTNLKTEEEKNRKVEIAVLVINLLAEKNCTVEEGEEILSCANMALKTSSTVRKIEQKPNREKEED